MGTEITKEKGGKKQVIILYKNKKRALSASALKIGPLPRTITYNSGTNTTGERAEASPSLRHRKEIILSFTAREIDRVGKETCVRCPLISEANSCVSAITSYSHSPETETIF